MDAQAYKRLNASFKKKLVYRIGVSAGFFSELNNMLLAMAYCLNHEIRFVLYSRNANFGLENGWTELFLPFTRESRIRLHATYNGRMNPALVRPERDIAQKVRLLKAVTRTDFLTHDLFAAVRNEAKSGLYYGFPSLDISGGIRNVLVELSGLAWRFNERTRDLVDKALAPLELPGEYVSFHIRNGDKVTEAPVYGARDYIEVAQRSSSIRTAFVGTDDYSNIEFLVKEYPEWRFCHLGDESQRGYLQASFDAKPASTKRAELINLLASVEAMTGSKLFVGTFTSNVGSFVGMRMPKERCLDVSGSPWFVW